MRDGDACLLRDFDLADQALVIGVVVEWQNDKGIRLS